MQPIIKLENVTKEFKVLNRHEGIKGGIKDLFSRDYKTITAVNDVSLEIAPGEIVGYLGPNGAGKSTTIKMMTGILEPTSGTILCNGIVPYKKRSENAQNIGVVFGQRSQLWWALPAIESIKILRDIYQVDEKNYKDMMDLYANIVDMDTLMHKPVREMSLGQRTLCDILASFLHNPGVVFLDEPTIGLDVSMKGKIRELIKMLNKEKHTTVILTTHDMGDVDALCQRIVIIDKGSVLYNNDISHLTDIFGAYRTLSLSLVHRKEQKNENAINSCLVGVENLLKEKWQDNNFRISRAEDRIEILVNEAEANVVKVMNAVQEKYKIYDMKLMEISTEEIIRKIYEGGI